MKKLLLSLIAATIILFSCSKTKNETVTVEEEITVDVKKVEEVLDFYGDPGARVVAFNILNAAEKAYAFRMHIQNNYEKLKLNEEQREFIKETLKMIVPEMYMTDKKDNYMGTIAAFGHKATTLFTVNDYVRLFQNIQPFEKEIISSINAPVEDCYCKWNSTCTAYADTKGPDCIEGRSCTITNGGCGWLWLSDCKGVCGRL